MKKWKEKVQVPCRRRTRAVWRTQTGVVAHSIHTGGAVLAAVVLAVVHVGLAEGSVETERTRAAERTNRQNRDREDKYFIIFALHAFSDVDLHELL